MQEKTVTLSAHTAERLEEYRELYTRYEELVADNPKDMSDSELIAIALSDAINEMLEFLAATQKLDMEMEVTP